MSWKVLVCIISVAVFIKTDSVKAYNDHFHRKYDRICRRLGYQRNFELDKSIVAFNARLATNQINLPPHAVVAFRKVTLNEGNAYDADTGKFTAPTDGIYSFTWTILTRPGDLFQTYLLLNGNKVGFNNVHGRKSDNYETGTTTSIIKMKEHDRVWLSTVARAGFAHRDWSSFSGFRL
ncbi:complement C1q tumor necrosis factor-related protein 3-like [Saccostrea echinata]|uniref:complement C1q tumor necrosis factor-related protein 3-like n=1 Tax=Saccostrea echinata TaxID=191078 RepID=UPI002A82FE2A|nr:complement C1q tumor necrosis factor-related protein 3-like [Saccostrea echinata]